MNTKQEQQQTKMEKYIQQDIMQMEKWEMEQYKVLIKPWCISKLKIRVKSKHNKL